MLINNKANHYEISRTILTTLIAGACITACNSNQGKQMEQQEVKTPEAVAMLDMLKAVPQQGNSCSVITMTLYMVSVGTETLHGVM